MWAAVNSVLQIQMPLPTCYNSSLKVNLTRHKLLVANVALALNGIRPKSTKINEILLFSRNTKQIISFFVR